MIIMNKFKMKKVNIINSKWIIELQKAIIYLIYKVIVKLEILMLIRMRLDKVSFQTNQKGILKIKH